MGSAPGDQQAGPARGTVRDRRRELGAFLRSRRARFWASSDVAGPRT